jgi:hypothetical protein
LRVSNMFFEKKKVFQFSDFEEKQNSLIFVT